MLALIGWILVALGAAYIVVCVAGWAIYLLDKFLGLIRFVFGKK